MIFFCCHLVNTFKHGHSACQQGKRTMADLLLNLDVMTAVGRNQQQVQIKCLFYLFIYFSSSVWNTVHVQNFLYMIAKSYLCRCQ